MSGHEIKITFWHLICFNQLFFSPMNLVMMKHLRWPVLEIQLFSCSQSRWWKPRELVLTARSSRCLLTAFSPWVTALLRLQHSAGARLVPPAPLVGGGGGGRTAEGTAGPRLPRVTETNVSTRGSKGPGTAPARRFPRAFWPTEVSHQYNLPWLLMPL